MKDYLRSNLERLKELRTQVDEEQANLEKAQGAFDSVRNRFVNLRRFLEAEIEVERDTAALSEFREIVRRRDLAEPDDIRLRVQAQRRIDIGHGRPVAQNTRSVEDHESVRFPTPEPTPTFNKTRFIVELWASENSAGRGVNARSLLQVARDIEGGKQITPAYVHNTISRFKQAGRAEQREDGLYYLTAEGLNYLEGGDA
ncbi:MAG: hypothetical protein IPI64_00645 [Chloracidobacterium sp.]|nr:hypothetical protein [Chloracidobacterium sp.]